MEDQKKQEKKFPLTEKILEKIKSHQIKMRPKFYFVLKGILVMAAILIVGVFILFLISFIGFHLRASGVWYLPGFGLRALGPYFRLFPWILIIGSLILIVILEILVRRYSFAWRWPAFYSLLIIILIACIGGFLIEKSLLHPELFWQAKKGNLPFLIAPLYREFGAPKFKDVHRGVVENVTENGFLLRKANDELLTIIFEPETKFPFDQKVKEGDSVVVMGKREDDTVHAFGVTKIDDQLRFFERKLSHPSLSPIRQKNR